MDSELPDAQTRAVLELLHAVMGEAEVLGVYLYGSAVVGGLRPDSDLDLFVVTGRPLSDAEKRGLVAGLLPLSDRETRRPAWRPLEVTIVLQGDVRPWRYPPRFEFQYGEWLRSEFLGGVLAPWPATNPDVGILITMVLASGRPLFGPPAAHLLDPVPHRDLLRAMADEIGTLRDDLDGDTRNVLLTLARMWTTAATGEIRSKDEAAAWALERLSEEQRPVLERARRLYLRGGYGPWDDMTPVREAADAMVTEIGRLVGERGE